MHVCIFNNELTIKLQMKKIKKGVRNFHCVILKQFLVFIINKCMKEQNHAGRTDDNNYNSQKDLPKYINNLDWITIL